MKFKYRAYKNIANPDVEYGKMPLLQVILRHGKNYVDLDCLVDSGAGECLFGTHIAVALGIDLKKAEKRSYEGIGDVTVKGVVHPVMLNVKGLNDWLRIDVGFIDENEMPILGQTGFFDNYQLIFRGYQNQFEIKKRPN